MGDQKVSILPVRPGTISADDKAALRGAGVIVIEHENPLELQVLAQFDGAFPRGPVIDAAVSALALFPTDCNFRATEADRMRCDFIAKLAMMRKKEQAHG